MNKLIILLFNVVSAKVFWSWRGAYLWRVNIDVQFTLTCVHPGETEIRTIHVDGNEGAYDFRVVSYYVFKIHFKSGSYDIITQVTSYEKGYPLFHFDWIQVKYNDAEIGSIQGPIKVQGISTKRMEDRRIIHLQDKISYMQNNIDVHVTRFCINYAFNQFTNAIGFYDPCYGPMEFGPRPERTLPIIKEMIKKTTTVPPKTEKLIANELIKTEETKLEPTSTQKLTVTTNTLDSLADTSKDKNQTTEEILYTYKGSFNKTVNESFYSSLYSRKSKKAIWGIIVIGILCAIIAITTAVIVIRMIYRKKQK